MKKSYKRIIVNVETSIHSIKAEASSIKAVENLINELVSNGFELCDTRFEQSESGRVLVNLEVKIEQKSLIENCINDITLYGKI